MKIFHLINTLSAGGAELHLLTLCRYLKLAGAKVIVGYMKEVKGSRSLRKDFEAEGIRLVALGGERPWDVRCLWRAMQLVRKERPELLHTHLPKADFLGFLIRAIRPSIPWVFSAHDIYSRSWRGHWLLPFFLIVWRLADQAIAISEAVKKWLVEEYDLQDRKIQVIYYGIESECFSKPSRDLRREWHLNENPTIGTLARLESRKGHDLLIQAMPLILNTFPKATLLIAGHNPWGYGHKLQALIDKLGLREHVQLIGFQEEIPSFLHAIDVFAFASRSEGFGQVVIEAMAAGRPVVVPRIAPLTEIVLDNEVGLCVEPESPEALAKAIIWLLSHPKERKQMGEKGARRVREMFSAEKMSLCTLKLYEEVLSRKISK